MARLCLLVSRPLDKSAAPKTMPPWAAIGNHAAIPNIVDKIPLFTHWALCVIDAEDVDLTSPSSRQLFVDAAYFDLGVLSSNGTASGICCRSDSYDLHDTSLRWPEYLVRTISNVQSIGITSRRNEWICDLKSQLDESWGDYLPLLWNCQIFAVMLAQLVVASVESASLLKQIMCCRKRSIARIRASRDGVCGVITAVGISIPVRFMAWAASATAGAYIITDGSKDLIIDHKVDELVEEYPQLRPVFKGQCW